MKGAEKCIDLLGCGAPYDKDWGELPMESSLVMRGTKRHMETSRFLRRNSVFKIYVSDNLNYEQPRLYFEKHDLSGNECF